MRQAVTNSARTISSIKRDMGAAYKAKIDKKEFTLPEISAIILQRLKKSAEDYLGEAVTEAAITVPAYFTDAQRSTPRQTEQGRQI